MDIDRQHFVDHGFVIIRGLIPPSRLAELRASYEVLVDRQRAIWAAIPEAADHWATTGQPRLNLNDLVDAPSAGTLEFCLGDSTLGVSQRLLATPDVSPTGFMMMCSPQGDHGPANWHRDVSVCEPAPLRGMQALIDTYGPQYVQWNIALYDDDVLWVVPGSHRRINTPEEDRQLVIDKRVPLPGSIATDLRAGDAVAYILPILHWASRYTSKLRRCIHLGYRAFGGQSFSYVHWRHWDPTFVHHLSPAAQRQFARFEELWLGEHELIAGVFRAAIARDAAGFDAALRRLHPGKAGRMVSVVMLSKLARKIWQFKQLDISRLTPEVRAAKIRAHWFGTLIFDGLTQRFSAAEAQTLWQRFAALDAALHLPGGEPKVVPWSQGGPSPYEPNDMPAGMDVKGFVASWG